jgi:RNA-binding protein
MIDRYYASKTGINHCYDLISCHLTPNDKAQTMNPEASESDPLPGPVDRQVAGRELRELKAKAQRLSPFVKLGKEGLSDSFLAGLDQALSDHELVKVKFEEFKEQKKELAPALAARTRAQIIMRVGNVVVLFRRRAEAGPAA